MAGVSDKALFGLGPFTDGVNNVAPETAPPLNENGQITTLREGVNVDLDAMGRARRRRGYDYEVAGEAHSLFATDDHLFAVVDGSLVAYADVPLANPATIRAVGPRYVSLTTDEQDVFWSNGVESGRIDATLSDLPLWVATPDPVQAVAASAGGLAAGNYEVSATVLDAAGRESGASNPVVVTLTAGQGITVTLPAKPDTTAAWRVYVSPPNGEVLYLAGEYASATTSLTIGAHTPGKALDTAWLFPMPPCRVLRYGHSRLLGLTDDALLWSEPYRLGLMADQNYIGLNRGTLLEPVGEGGDGAGWYMGDAKTVYFFEGADPKAARQRRVAPCAAVPGTSLTVPGSVFGLQITEPVAFWLGTNGIFYIGLPGGQVQPVREGQLAMPVNAERGAAGYFEHQGIRQILTSFIGGDVNPLGVTDSAEAEIRRHGITL